ncbi:MAG: LuxR C-terminal-related transcriptional regulator [Solirubrobacteraceae bacterium]
MSDRLARAIAEVLGADERPLVAAARLVRRAFAVDRVSIARIDRRSGRFEIAASAGADLLAPGTALPVSTCSYFAEVAEDRPFQEEDFDASREFSRPLDGVVIAAGFHAGCSAPIRRGGLPIGAISLSSADRGRDMTQAVRRLLSVCPALAGELTPRCAPAPPSVLVCGSDPLAVRGVARLAEQTLQARCEVATTLASALAAAEELAPDVIVCEERLGGRRVDQFAAGLRRAGGEKPLLVLATRDTSEARRAARRAGAAAYVARRDAISALPEALCAVQGGRTLMPADPPTGERLTERELELLEALDQGLRFKQVAGRFGIAETTAKTHGRNLFRKLGSSSRAEAVRAGRDRGLLA